LKNSAYRKLPIDAFAQRLFLIKAYDLASDVKKEKMRLVAAK